MASMEGLLSRRRPDRFWPHRSAPSRYGQHLSHGMRRRYERVAMAASRPASLPVPSVVIPESSPEPALMPQGELRGGLPSGPAG